MSKLSELGCLSATVQHTNTTIPAILYVVRTGTDLLGMHLLGAPRLSIGNNTMLSPAVPVAEIKAGPVTVEKLGHTKFFIHHVKVREGVQPVLQKLRKLPLSVKQAHSAELGRED